MQNTEDAAACGHLEVIYVLLRLPDLVVILSTRGETGLTRFLTSPSASELEHQSAC